MAKPWNWRWLVIWTGLVCTLPVVINCDAAEIGDPPSQNRSAENAKRSDASSAKPSDQRDLDKEIERGVLQMVNNHLPEIKVLLDQLRDNEPRQYESAIRNLAKSSRRLQAARKRGEEAFELEVHIVQAQSSINLLIAKLKVRDNKMDRKALLEATRRIELAEIERAKHELASSQSRLARMQEQVTALEKRLLEKQTKLNETVDKDFQSYLRKSGRK